MSRSEERRVGKECRSRWSASQAEDGIRDKLVTGVQTCALPISNAVEKMITATFSPLKARAAAQPDPDLGRIVPFTGIRAHFHPEPEAPATSVSISSLAPFPHEQIGRASCRERV